jgi:sugar (pentulose or hexulose) kinase
MPSNEKYIIGIDGGTQSTKVMVFDLQGNIVSQARVALQPLHQPTLSIAEHPADDLWSTLGTACQQALAQLTELPGQIVAVGLCSIRCCRAELTKHGELISPVLSWMDLRLAKAYQQTNPLTSYVTTASGYLSHRLTGQFRDTAANYEGMWPIDKSTWQWSTDAAQYAACGVPREMLFELCNPGAVLGAITAEAAKHTGIPAGTPVVATANDKAVEALGAGLSAGAASDSSALISLGTYIGAMVNGDENRPSTASYFSNMSAIPNQYLLESAGVRNGMGNISWFKNLFASGLLDEAAALGCSAEAVLDREATSVAAGCDGLVSVPDWLAPTDKLYKRGAMIGLHNGHTRAHMHRSMLEAIALTMHNHLNAMLGQLGRDVEQVIISGGGANSDVFCQIFADVLGKPVQRNKVHDAAALGAAISATVALGLYNSFATASENMVKRSDTVTPKPLNQQIYKQLNQQVFQNITLHTDKILTKLYPIFNSQN